MVSRICSLYLEIIRDDAEVCAMVDDGQSKQAVRGLITIIVNGVALLAFGLGMTGWLNPWLGVSIMGIAMAYWIWELFNAPLGVQSIPPMLRFVGAIVLACIVVGVSVPRIRDKQPSPTPTDKNEQVVSVVAIQADATRLINHLTETVADAYRDQEYWTHPPPSIRPDIARWHLQRVIAEFDENYRGQYQQEIMKVYGELMGQLKIVPEPPPGMRKRDQIYARVEEGTPVRPAQGEEQLDDLCVLLEEMQKENNLTPTCSFSAIITKLHSM